MVYLLPFLSYLVGPKNVCARPSDPDTMTNTVLEATASSSGQIRIMLLSITCSLTNPHEQISQETSQCLIRATPERFIYLHVLVYLPYAKNKKSRQIARPCETQRAQSVNGAYVCPTYSLIYTTGWETGLTHRLWPLLRLNLIRCKGLRIPLTS